MPFFKLGKKRVRAYYLKSIGCKKLGDHCEGRIKMEMFIIGINNSVYKYVCQSPSEISIKCIIDWNNLISIVPYGNV